MSKAVAGSGRNRERWFDEEKHAIVAETWLPGPSLTTGKRLTFTRERV